MENKADFLAQVAQLTAFECGDVAAVDHHMTARRSFQQVDGAPDVGSHGVPDAFFIPLLKESVRDLCRMTMQRTAGQRKDRRSDIPFDNLDRLKWTILMEACLLVLSGKLDALEGGAESETV